MRPAFALAAVLAVAGCAGTRAAGGEAALLDADRALSKKLLESGAADAFGEYFDEHGIQLTTSGTPAVGPAQVRARVPSGVLSREPRHAEDSNDGDWGWTWGDWQLHERGAGGKRLAQGRYLNVWSKESGEWKVRADLGSADPAP